MTAPTPPPPPPPPVVQPAPPVYAPAPAPPPVYTREEAPRYETRQTSQFDQNYDSHEPESKDSVMKLTQMVIVGAAIALLGFFAWRMFLQPRPVSAPELAATASVTGVADQQVTPISPAQLRRVNVATEARGVPDAAGPIIAQLPAGSVLDVSGQIVVNGVSWLRVSLPNDSSKSGFVREDQLVNLGDGTLAVTPVDQLPGGVPAGTVPPGTPAAVPEVVGPIQAREPATFYVASLQANIRSEANATSTKVGAFEFSDAITVIGQRTVGSRVWYQVQLPSGGSGWINGRLVSTSPRDIPLDRETAQGTGKAVQPVQSPKVFDKAGDDPSALDPKPALTAVSPGTTMRVDATVANLRKEPGATGNSIVEVLQRDTLMSVEDVRVLNGVPWYRVTSPNGAQGWVSGRTVVENR